MINIWAVCAIQYTALNSLFLSSQHFTDEEIEIQDVPSLPKVTGVERSGPGEATRHLGSSTQDLRQLRHCSPNKNVFDFSVSFCSRYCMRSYFYSLESKHIQFCFLLFFHLMSFSGIFPTYCLHMQHYYWLPSILVKCWILILLQTTLDYQDLT